MTAPSFRILALDGRDRQGMCCAQAALNRYFHSHVSQDQRRRVAACFIAEDRISGRIAGYYTLSAGSIQLADLPDDLAGRLPRYPNLPVARLGRLAVDQSYAGQKLGSALLADAVLRAAASDVAVFAMVVDAKDEVAAGFYRHHGFVPYASAPGRLLAPFSRLLPKG